MHSFLSKRLVLVVVGIVWLEFSFLPLLSLKDIKPDFFSIFLAFYAFRVNWRQIVPLAFFVGVVQDLITNSFFGLETVSYVGGALLLRFFAIRFDQEKRWVQLAGLFSVSWLVFIIFLVFSFLFEVHYSSGEWILTKTVLIALYTTILGSLLFPLLEKYLLPILGPRQYELFPKA